VADVNNCSSSGVTSITVNPLPTINAGTTNTLICSGQTATLSASGANTFTWSPGGTGASIVVSPSVNTVYTVSGTDSNGCQNTTTITQSVSACTNINSSGEALGIRIYPNPFSNKISIESDHSGQSIQMFDVLGSLQYEKKNKDQKTEIDLSHLSSGVYFIRVNGYTKKLLKE
jgi:hypothetical protein